MTVYRATEEAIKESMNIMLKDGMLVKMDNDKPCSCVIDFDKCIPEEEDKKKINCMNCKNAGEQCQECNGETYYEEVM